MKMQIFNYLRNYQKLQASKFLKIQNFQKFQKSKISKIRNFKIPKLKKKIRNFKIIKKTHYYISGNSNFSPEFFRRFIEEQPKF